MEKKTERIVAGCKTTDGGRFHWNSCAVVPNNCIAASKKEAEFCDWVDEFMAEERDTRPVDYSKPGKVTRPFVIPNVIDDDLNLILPPLSSSSSSSILAKNEDEEKKGNCYVDDELKDNNDE